MDIPLFSEYGVNYLVRWGHLLFGIVWIGLLYYFNFVQTEYFKEADADHRSGAIQKLVPRALWWFRWGAAFTFLTGLYLLYRLHGAMTYDITVGATLGTLMAFNVWFIIWPNQKIVIASATQVAGGGEALPEAAAAAPKPVWRLGPTRCFPSQCCFLWGLRRIYQAVWSPMRWPHQP